MKKLFASFLFAGLIAFVACGPSAEKKAEQARQDSIRMADSMAKVEADAQRIADSTAKVKAAADSIAHQDSIAKGLIKVKKGK